MEDSLSPAVGGVFAIFYLALIVLMIASLWKLFNKAGQPGWAAIVPFYNIYVMITIAGKPGWWLVLFLVPLVNIVIEIIVLLGLAKNFGKGGGYVVGMIFLPYIFFPILAFGDAKYVG